MKTMRNLTFYDSISISEKTIAGFPAAGGNAAIARSQNLLNNGTFIDALAANSNQLLALDASAKTLGTARYAHKSYQITPAGLAQVASYASLTGLYYKMYSGSLALSSHWQNLTLTEPVNSTTDLRRNIILVLNMWGIPIMGSLTGNWQPTNVALQVNSTRYQNIMIPHNSVVQNSSPVGNPCVLCYSTISVQLSRTDTTHLQLSIKQFDDSNYYFNRDLSRGGNSFGYIQLRSVISLYSID